MYRFTVFHIRTVFVSLLLIATCGRLSAQSDPYFGSAMLSYGYNAQVDYSQIGIGYNLTFLRGHKFIDRVEARALFDYLPAQQTIGFTAGTSFTHFNYRAGLETSYRHMTEAGGGYMALYPNIGLDFLAAEVGVGPEFVFSDEFNKNIGFKVCIRLKIPFIAGKMFGDAMAY